ncbi:hypothetical protein HKO22_02895 [Peptoniphilus sp. AGMB00490]|uniref:Mu-like prophage FluMu protein gp28 n=1 Tax=Peptoniphilus faecalis TaxID=2731255 RepID=A0A848RG52_9FIRM|nr:terminase family protein [Peptoniphilus faecalis]NMW84691.1 hypothetical protein [Peptoniphilus faecalis]
MVEITDRTIGMTSREIYDLKKKLLTKEIEYYRNHIDIFCEEYLNIPLNLYQKVSLRAMAKYNFIVLVWSRGLGKTWLSALYVCCMAILYPNLRIGVIAPSFRQSKMLVEDKIDNDLCIRSDALRQEIVDYKNGTDQIIRKFANNSQIIAIPIGNSGSKIRGGRFSIIIADEYAQMNPNIVQSVIKPMMVAKLDYKVDAHEDEEFFDMKFIAISSAFFKFNHLYEFFKDTIKQIARGSDKHYASCLDYKVGLDVGLYNESVIEEAKRTYSKLDFDMEYDATFPDLSDDNWINPMDLIACSNLMKMDLSFDENYQYIMGLDVARTAGNDNTAIVILKLVPYKKKQVLEKHLVYQKTLNGKTFNEQATAIRKILNKFPCDEIHMDTTGLGLGLLDELAKSSIDPITNEIEPPLCDVNNEEHKKNILDGNFIIHGHKFSLDFNHQLGMSVKQNTQKRLFRMYSQEALDDVTNPTVEEVMVLEEAMKTRREIMSIEAKPRGNFLTFDVPSGGISEGRKDRWTATGLALLGADNIEKNMFRDTNNVITIGAIGRRDFY